jgi:hypothetical protein
MAYSRSNAREEFESEASKLKKLAKKVSYLSSPFSYDHKQLIYQSCIFLLSARIEDYTKNFIESIFFNYKIKGATLSQIPENSRIKALIEIQKVHFKNFYNQEDEKKLIKNLSLKSGTYNLVFDNVIYTNQVKAGHVIGTNKYPSIKNLNKVYNRLGIDDIVVKINIKAKKDLKTSFESFLSLRESIAHQSTSNLTYLDIERNFNNVLEFVQYIDRIVYSHICEISSSQFWN